LPSLWLLLPTFLALPIRSLVRARMRRANLHDTSHVDGAGNAFAPWRAAAALAGNAAVL
jgi:hypothetical protein